MTDRDDELDQILSPLAKLNPPAQQLSRWQLARGPRRALSNQYLQLAAAAVIGFLIATVIFKNQGAILENDTKFDNFATIETVYIKSE